jgi:MinD-like ATPase involved in chromosome partitioning or flagellar assembly
VLVAFGSAKGAPGVTTTARVLASVWPSEVVLVDADPAGGDVSLLARTPDRGALDPERGLLSLAADARRGLVQGGVGEHLQQIEGGLDVLCGVSTPEQMTGIAPVWPALAGELATVRGTDVIVDCGRVAASSAVLPVVIAADVLVLVARPRLESFAHLRERLRWLAHLQDTTARVPAVGVVIVADSRDKRSLSDLQQLLAHERLPASVLGQVALDERAADVVAGRLERPIARSLLVRSVRQLVEPVAALAASRSAVRRPA